jgi:hypothetical protein
MVRKRYGSYGTKSEERYEESLVRLEASRAKLNNELLVILGEKVLQPIR